MNIQTINNYKVNTYFSGQKTLNSAKIHNEPISDTFWADKTSYDYFMQNNHKFTINDYFSMSEEAKEKARSLADEDLKTSVDYNISLGIDLKKGLDKAYGTNDYTFVSIGTSPSLIGKTLEFMGVDVIYLPISKLSSPFHNNPEYKDVNLKPYLKFLKSQGVSFMDSIKNHKKYLFYDYTRTGSTLKYFEEIIREKVHMPKFNMEFRSLNEDLFASSGSDRLVMDYIDYFLDRSLAEKYSSIKSLPYKDIPNTTYTPENLTNYSNENVKLFNFLLADKLNNYNRLKPNAISSKTL